MSGTIQAFAVCPVHPVFKDEPLDVIRYRVYAIDSTVADAPREPDAGIRAVAHGSLSP
jgi:hypothetical protein